MEGLVPEFEFIITNFCKKERALKNPNPISRYYV